MNKYKVTAIIALTVIHLFAPQKLVAQEDDSDITNTSGLASDKAVENENTVDLAYIYVDNPNGKFGEYNGFDENNNYFVFGMDWLQRSEEDPGQYLDLKIHNLGLATFAIQGEQGRQGNYRVRGGYDQIQKVYHGDALTIYDNNLETLPEPQDISTSTQRKTVNAGFDKFLGSRWVLETDVRSQTKEGLRSRPTNTGLIVPQNVDFKHNEFEASLSYASEHLQLVFDSYVSDFSNNNGLILNTAAEPDNQFYKLSVNGGGAITNTSRLTGYLAYSNAKQKDDFEKYGIADGTYSTNSLNAEYGTTNAQLKYRNRLTRKLNLDINYRLEKRNNNTPLYNDFPSDKNNKVYEWDKQKLNVNIRYRLPARWRLLGGLQLTDYAYKVNKSPRSTGRLPEQASTLEDNTDELTARLEVRTPFVAGFYGNLKYSRSDRDVDLDPVREAAATVDTEGLALSFFLVPRVQDKIDLLVNYSINQSLSAGLNFSIIKDDYDAIAWASINKRESNRLSIDINYSPSSYYSLNAYAGIDDYNIEQSGFGSLGDDSSFWEYETADESEFLGITGKLHAFSGKVDFRLNYHYQQGNAQYETFDPSDVSGAFPGLETIINRFTLEADILMSEDVMINILYRLEDYDSDSWVWKNDYTEPENTYFDVLNYGYDSPEYISHLIMVSVTYQF